MSVGRRTRAVAMVLAMVMVPAGAASVVAPAPAAAAPAWLDEVKPPAGGPASPPVERARSAAAGKNMPAAPAAVKLPAAGTQVVSLGTTQQRVAAAGGALSVAPRDDKFKGTKVRVETLGRTAGATAFAFRLSNADSADAVPVRVSVDYSGFADAYGGGYGDRLKVVALPSGNTVPSRNDAAQKRLVVDASAASATVFAVTSDVSGENGTYAATSLAVSDKWQVSPGTGEFSWSYGIDVPQPPAGIAPAVGLSYSSGSVDGLVSTRNTQGPQSGVGFSDFASSFVERRYESCAATGDLCWKNQNATISLNGNASELAATDSTYEHWKLKQDPGWTVDHLHGAYANGDENKEYWKVTTPDGVQYFFGLGNNPDTGQATDSVWTVPVLADNPQEPCRKSATEVGACQQAWRWNLDRMVDPNGITTTYFYGKETNKYRTLGGLGTDESYVRSGYLKRIEYGKPAGTGAEVFPAGRVIFETQNRCDRLAADCGEPTSGNGANFRDVPNDLICESNCLVTSPTFFSGKRYASVRTEVRTGGAWLPVEQTNLFHTLTKKNGDGHIKLYLASIQRVGLAQTNGALDKALRMPLVDFDYTELPNRVDINPSADKTAMGHFRLTGITDEYGGKTIVTYGQPNKCANGYAGPWESNTKDCFPQKLGTRFGVFHKYLTTRVEVRDTLGGGVSAVTTYAYEGTPAWHHDDDEFVRGVDQSWSDWRGYGTTLITEGPERTRVQTFRGMNADNMPNGQARSVKVAPLANTGFGSTAVMDEPWLAGATFVEARLGPQGEVADATMHEYQARVGPGAPTDPKDWVVWVGETRTTTNTAKTTGGFAQQRTTTTYNANFNPETVYEEGWLDRAGDERCTRIGYATVGAIVTNPSGVTTLAGACSSSTVLSQTETAYDTRGNAIRQRVRLDATKWVTAAETTYDALGRAYRVTDAKGLVTETTHEATPNGGFPRTTTVTERAGGTSYVTNTEWLPEYGVPVKETDANGKVTTYRYDPLGRTLCVRQATEQSAPANVCSWEFGYAVSLDKAIAPIVRTKQLQSNDLTTYQDSWVVYDSLLRPRQTQAFSPQANKAVVTATSYNDRGLVEDETEPQAVDGTPGWGLLPVTWKNKTKTTYDALGRPSREGWYRDNAEQWATATTYTHDTTTVQQPGSRMSRSTVDGLGRVAKTEEHDGSAWQATTNGYDLADRLTSVTDPAGNRITYTYNMVGWRLSQDDPDAGAWSFGYDDAGNQTAATDAKGAVTYTAYDTVGRPTERRSGGATGTVLARWEYDAPGEKGLLNRSIRVTPQGEWVVDVSGYDARNRPVGTRWTVPAGVSGLSGSYPIGYGYDRADNLTSVSYPAIGGLPSEIVTTRYNSLGLPDRMSGIDEYVWTAGYDDRGRPSTVGLGPRPNGQTWLARNWTYDADQRLARMQTATGGSTVVDHQFSYDLIGTLTSRTTVLGGQSWRECYGYDVRDRLTSAYTTTATACDGTGRGTGAQPYDHRYTYAPDGNLKTRVENGTTYTYTYPTGSGVDRPHAPTGVGSDGYTWDANGNLATRKVAGSTETLTWDPDRMLASVTGPGGTTSFLYDADGSRLLRTTPAGRTLYIAGHEITATASGSAVIATRSYEFAGDLVATRTPSGVDYLVTDQQDSTEATLPAGGALDVSRSYLPYGEKRAGGDPDTDQGWIGQVEDDTTKLSYLNARYYDPNLGTFLSPDPLYDTDAPQTINAYSYGTGDPVNASDPSGLKSCWGWECSAKASHKHKPSPKAAAKAARKIGKAVGHAVGKINRAIRSVARGIAAVGRHLRNAFAGVGKAVGRAAKAYHDRVTLQALHKANPDPGFWRAIAKAGSGQALVLGALHAANPDPGFWRALAKAGSGKRLAAIAKRIDKANRANATAGAYRLVAAGPGRAVHVVGFPCWHNDEGGCHGGGITDGVDNFVDGFNCTLSNHLRTGGPQHGCETQPTDYILDAAREVYAGCANEYAELGFSATISGVLARSSQKAAEVLREGVGVTAFATICLAGIFSNHVQVVSPP